MENNALIVYFCGRQCCEPEQVFGPVVRPHYILYIVLNGKGMLQKGPEMYHLEQGDVFLTRPNEKAYFEADAYEPWEYAWICFEGDSAEALLKNTTFANRPVYRLKKDQEYYFACADRLVDRFMKMDYQVLELTGALIGLLGPMMIENRILREDYKELYLTRGKAYLENNYCYDVRIRDAAKYAGIDRSYLYRIFMEKEHMAPKQYLMEYRIARAKRMMTEEGYSITEAACSCGFSDAESFAYHFRQNCGITPQEFLWKMLKS